MIHGYSNLNFEDNGFNLAYKKTDKYCYKYVLNSLECNEIHLSNMLVGCLDIKNIAIYDISFRRYTNFITNVTVVYIVSIYPYSLEYVQTLYMLEMIVRGEH